MLKMGGARWWHQMGWSHGKLIPGKPFRGCIRGPVGGERVDLIPVVWCDGCTGGFEFQNAETRAIPKFQKVQRTHAGDQWEACGSWRRPSLGGREPLKE